MLVVTMNTICRGIIRERS